MSRGHRAGLLAIVGVILLTQVVHYGLWIPAGAPPADEGIDTSMHVGQPDSDRDLESVGILGQLRLFLGDRLRSVQDDAVGSVYQPFPQGAEDPITAGMPARPRCINFTVGRGTHPVHQPAIVPCRITSPGAGPWWFPADPDQTCRGYECFVRCWLPERPCGGGLVCLHGHGGYCVPLARVDHQLEEERIAARLQAYRPPTIESIRHSTGATPNFQPLFEVLRSTGQQPRHAEAAAQDSHPLQGPLRHTDLSPLRASLTIKHGLACTRSLYTEPPPDNFDPFTCSVASYPICYGYVPGKGYGVCIPVYPNVNKALWESFHAIGDTRDLLAELAPLIKQNGGWADPSLATAVAHAGLCKVFQEAIHQLQGQRGTLPDESSGWWWECRSERTRTFYNSARFSIGAGDMLFDPPLVRAGHLSIDMDVSSASFQHHRQERPYDWDMFMYGHIHGGKTYWDGMLNTSKLTPRHVFHTCMGCIDGYCSKRGMCEDALAAGMNGEVCPECKLMPEGDADILADFRSKHAAARSTRDGDGKEGAGGWVIKIDGANMHMGVGTTIVTDLDTYLALRKTWMSDDSEPDREQVKASFDGASDAYQNWKLPKSSFVAQRYIAPWLGIGRFHRKFEIRTYAIVISTNPLRLYLYRDSFVVLAFSRYNETENARLNSLRNSILRNQEHPMPTTPKPEGDGGAEGQPSWCMHDTHVFREGSTKCDTDGLSEDDRVFTLERWCELNNLSSSKCDRIRQRYGERIRNAVLSSHRGRVSTHPVNMGITSSGARCMSLLRIDITLGPDLEPYIMEINQDPYLPHAYSVEALPTLILRGLFEEYYAMIGWLQNKRPAVTPVTFRKLTKFCLEQQCTAAQFISLQRMEAERHEMQRFIPLFPDPGLSASEAARLRGYLPDTERAFDIMQGLWLAAG